MSKSALDITISAIFGERAFWSSDYERAVRDGRLRDVVALRFNMARSAARAHLREGNRTMAYSKRLQANYWKRRMQS